MKFLYVMFTSQILKYILSHFTHWDRGWILVDIFAVHFYFKQNTFYVLSLNIIPTTELQLRYISLEDR